MLRSVFLASVAVLPIAFSNEICETVIVKIDGNSVRINKSDYDANPDAYTLDKPATKKADGEDEPTTTAPSDIGSVPDNVIEGKVPSSIDNGDGQLPNDIPLENSRLVAKDGKKFFVVNEKGERIVHLNIDPNGYATEDLAWAAIKALPR